MGRQLLPCRVVTIVALVDEQEEWLDDSFLPVYHPVNNGYMTTAVPSSTSDNS